MNNKVECCPCCCSASSNIRTGKRLDNETSKTYYQCLNPICGIVWEYWESIDKYYSSCTHEGV